MFKIPDPVKDRRKRIRLSSLFLVLLGVLLPCFSYANAINILDVEGSKQVVSAEWCKTTPSLTIESINTSECKLQPLRQGVISPDYGNQAFWIRLELTNPGFEHIERWINVGNPRLDKISLFMPEGLEWVRSDVGLLVPVSERKGRVEQEYGLFSVTLSPRSSLVVWIRVYSDSAIDLTTTLWDSNAYLHSNSKYSFWIAVGSGSLFILSLLSVVIAIKMRQIAYLYFSLGQFSYVFHGLAFTGLFQRFIWPNEWPVTHQLFIVFSTMGLISVYGFLNYFIPQRRKYKKLNIAFELIVVILAILLVISPFNYFSNINIAWKTFEVLLNLCACMLCYKARRDGDKLAWVALLIYFTNLFFMGLRALALFGLVNVNPNTFVFIPVVLTIASMATILALLYRSQEIEKDLLLSRNQNALQLKFIANMSHELRGPLDVMLGSALLMRKSQNPSIAHYITTILDSGHRLLGMIDHILDYTRGTVGSINISREEVNINSFLNKIAKISHVYASKQNNQFTLTINNDYADIKNFLLDSGHLWEILDNLLANSAKHTHNGTITLICTIKSLEKKSVRMSFTVSDTGEGIDLKDQQRIFQPFVRLSHDKKGTGLGLTIARQLAELMGGELTVESRLGHGASFHLWIPVIPLLKNESTQVERPALPTILNGYLGYRRKILIIDDSQESLNVLTDLFTSIGFFVLQSTGGYELADILKNIPELDLVITEQFMPVYDGWSVLETVSAKNPDLPVLLISASAPVPPENWPAECRFSKTFLRPLDHDELVEYVFELLELNPVSEFDENNNSKEKPIAESISIATHPYSSIYDDSNLKKPDKNELKDLKHLVETGQMSLITQWATDFEMSYPEYKEFAELVVIAAQNLELQALTRLCEDTES